MRSKIKRQQNQILSFKFYLSMKTKLLLYYSFIVSPYHTYCNLTWSSTYVTNLNRIFLIQKRIVCAITNAPYCAHSAPMFAQLKLLDIYKLNSFYTAKFMFSYIHSLLPPPFLHLFTRNNNFPNYSTRTTSNGPFAAGGHMVQNPPCWRASCPLGHPQQRKCKFVLMKSLCSGCPSGQLALQHGGFCTM